MLRLFGQTIEITEEMECFRGGDHGKLVHDARVDYLKHAMSPDDKYVLCGRCAKAVSLKI